MVPFICNQHVPAPVGHSIYVGLLRLTPAFQLVKYISFVWHFCTLLWLKLNCLMPHQAYCRHLMTKGFMCLAKRLASMQLMAFFFSSFNCNPIRHRKCNQKSGHSKLGSNQGPALVVTLPFDCWGSCAFHLTSVLHMHGCILVFSYNEHALHVRLWHKLGQAFKFFASHWLNSSLYWCSSCSFIFLCALFSRQWKDF